LQSSLLISPRENGIGDLPLNFAEAVVLFCQRLTMLASIGFCALIGHFITCFCSGSVYALIIFGITDHRNKVEIPDAIFPGV
jgi:hypothetical protein